MNRVSNPCHVHNNVTPLQKGGGLKTQSPSGAAKPSSEKTQKVGGQILSMAPVEPSPEHKLELVGDVRKMTVKRDALLKAGNQLQQSKDQLLAKGNLEVKDGGVARVFHSGATHKLFESVLKSVTKLCEILQGRQDLSQASGDDPLTSLLERLQLDSQSQEIKNSIKFLVERLKIDPAQPSAEDAIRFFVDRIGLNHRERVGSVGTFAAGLAQGDRSLATASQLYFEMSNLMNTLSEQESVARGRRQRTTHPHVTRDISALVNRAGMLDTEVRAAINAAHEAYKMSRPNEKYCRDRFEEGAKALMELLVAQEDLRVPYEGRREQLEEKIERSNCSPLSEAGKDTVVNGWRLTSKEKLENREQRLQEVQSKRYEEKAMLDGEWSELGKRLEKIKNELNRLDHIASCGGVPPIKSMAFGRFIAVDNALKELGWPPAAKPIAKKGEGVEPTDKKVTSSEAAQPEEDFFDQWRALAEDEVEKAHGTASEAPISNSTQKLTLRAGELRKLIRDAGGIIESQCELLDQIEKQLKDENPNVKFLSDGSEKEYTGIRDQIFALRKLVNSPTTLERAATVQEQAPKPQKSGELAELNRNVSSLGDEIKTLRKVIKQAQRQNAWNGDTLEQQLLSLQEKRDGLLKKLREGVVLPSVERLVGQIGMLREAIKQAYDSARSNEFPDEEALKKRCNELEEQLAALSKERDKWTRSVNRKIIRLTRDFLRARRGEVSKADLKALSVLGFLDSEGVKGQDFKGRYESTQKARANAKSNLETNWKRLNDRIRETKGDLGLLKGIAFPEQGSYLGWWSK